MIRHLRRATPTPILPMIHTAGDAARAHVPSLSGRIFHLVTPSKKQGARDPASRTGFNPRVDRSQLRRIQCGALCGPLRFEYSMKSLFVLWTGLCLSPLVRFEIEFTSLQPETT
ncbi:hypothetical protein OH77DRAFT_786019 [Trametes cingulata]|nr:hypothetical protein OH77DRAFT_786019 [Trametes cingulata]